MVLNVMRMSTVFGRVYSACLPIKVPLHQIATHTTRLTSRMASASTASNKSASLLSASSKTLEARPKVLAIVGPTGSGKTKLAVDIALRHGNAEVVNSDVIQMYKGLDIASAKATTTERAGVPHHMLSFLEPTQPFTVRDFRSMAGEVIADIHGRGKLPIVVGGTMYYVQSILREALLEHDEADAAREAESRDEGDEARSGKSDAAALYDRLRRVDPIMAKRLHPNDVRKLERALQVGCLVECPWWCEWHGHACATGVCRCMMKQVCHTLN